MFVLYGAGVYGPFYYSFWSHVFNFEEGMLSQSSFVAAAKTLVVYYVSFKCE